MEKLASGFRINRAGDDAAGLQISENLRAQIRGSKKALDNVQDSMNVLSIVDGAYQQITDNLQRMRELTVQAANGTYATAQKTAIENELLQLRADIDRIASATQFNGVSLMDGSQTNFYAQIGANNTANDYLNLATVTGTSTFGAANSSALNTGLTAAALGTVDAGSSGDIRGLIDEIASALNTVNTRRGAIGALSNRLEGAANNLSIAIENFSSSESRIRNVDVAAESANLVRNQILQNAAATVLSQANQAPSLAMQLLQG